MNKERKDCQEMMAFFALMLLEIPRGTSSKAVKKYNWYKKLCLII